MVEGTCDHEKSMVSKQLTMLFMIGKEVSFRIYTQRMSWLEWSQCKRFR